MFKSDDSKSNILLKQKEVKVDKGGTFLKKWNATIVRWNSGHDEAGVVASVEGLVVHGPEVVADLVGESQRALIEFGVLAVVQKRHKTRIARLPKKCFTKFITKSFD